MTRTRLQRLRLQVDASAARKSASCSSKSWNSAASRVSAIAGLFLSSTSRMPSGFGRKSGPRDFQQRPCCLSGNGAGGSKWNNCRGHKGLSLTTILQRNGRNKNCPGLFLGLWAVSLAIALLRNAERVVTIAIAKGRVGQIDGHLDVTVLLVHRWVALGLVRIAIRLQIRVIPHDVLGVISPIRLLTARKMDFCTSAV